MDDGRRRRPAQVHDRKMKKPERPKKLIMASPGEPKTILEGAK
jgi:hypothetical protein